MFSRFHRLIGVCWLACIAALVALGCRTSPFLAAQFADNLTGLGPGRGPIITPTSTSAPTTTVDVNAPVASVCDLAADLRNIQVALTNESQQVVRFAMSFVVSAGPGGFVSCDDEILRYQNAGYQDACVPGACSTIAVGCDTVPLVAGTRLLKLDFGGNQTLAAANATGAPTTLQLTLQAGPFIGSGTIPLPEFIVFGSDNSIFKCSGDLCTQRGFVYFTPPPGNLAIGKAVEASTIQGTVCNKHFGTAPEWRLDKTPFNNLISPFQFPAGGTINATVLDRFSDSPTDTRNQAVWLVIDAAGLTVHAEER